MGWLTDGAARAAAAHTLGLLWRDFVGALGALNIPGAIGFLLLGIGVVGVIVSGIFAEIGEPVLGRQLARRIGRHARRLTVAVALVATGAWWLALSLGHQL